MDKHKIYPQGGAGLNSIERASPHKAVLVLQQASVRVRMPRVELEFAYLASLCIARLDDLDAIGPLDDDDDDDEQWRQPTHPPTQVSATTCATTT